MNHDDPEYAGSGRLQVAVKALQTIDVSDVADDLIRQTHLAMLQASRRRSWRMRASQVASVATIALVLLGLALATTHTSPSQVLAEVAGRVNATKTLRAVFVNANTRNGARSRGTLLVSGTRMRFESDTGAIISDAATRQQISLHPESKTAGRQQGVSPALDFYGIFRELSAAASTPIEDYVDKTGQHYPGLRGRAALKIGTDATWNLDAKVWSNPKTKLPVRLEIHPVDEGHDDEVILLEPIEFDVVLDDAKFDMKVPPGYALLGLSPDQLKPAPNKREAAELTIVPGVGIGKVKFGMSRAEIVAVFGEPELTMHDVDLCYPSKGLELVRIDRQEDRLGRIIANPWDAASFTRNEFPGQTDKGIRIGSTEKQVHDTYGAPDPPMPSDKPPRPKIARYKKLGLLFGFTDGKVDRIVASQTN